MVGHKYFEVNPDQTTDVVQWAYFPGGSVAINPNCRVCSVLPRAAVLMHLLGYDCRYSWCWLGGAELVLQLLNAV